MLFVEGVGHRSAGVAGPRKQISRVSEERFIDLHLSRPPRPPQRCRSPRVSSCTVRPSSRPFLRCAMPIDSLAELCQCLLRDQLLKRPFLDIGVLVLLQLGDELDRTLEDGAFVLLATGDDFGELVDAFVNGFAATTFNFELQISF